MPEAPDRVDYQETPDITEVHAAIQREHAEPSARVTPIPLWLTAVCAAVLVWAGLYFGIFNGGLSGSVFNEYDSSPAVLFPLPASALAGSTVAAPPQTLAEQGKSIFSNCVPCHQPSGMGVPGQFPPLVKSEYVLGSEKRIVAILLKGLQGVVEVEGKPFNGAMPAWEAVLSDKKIASVASFVRSTWGNQAPEISEAKVAAARKEFTDRKTPWTMAELGQIPADATLPDAAGAAPAPAAAGGGAAPAAAPAPAPAPAATPTAPAATPAPASTVPASPTAAPAPAPAAPVPAPTPAAPVPAPAAAVAPAPAAPAPAAGSSDLAASMERGKGIYMQTCFTCHQITGMGLPGAFPPLAQTDYTTGPARRMIAMILKGVNPPLKVKEMTYVVAMPPLPTVYPVLADDKNVADVINYVRNSFGNKDETGVTPEIVKSIRAEFASRANPWTEPELASFPAAGGAAAPVPAAPAPATTETPAPAASAPAPAPATPPQI